ncbi:MAG: flavocytochrome c [Desulfobacterales bacterium]|nr:flavocytochrome c [Desulfobacterales bacterium]
MKDSKQKQFSRRQFLKATGGATALAGVASAGFIMAIPQKSFAMPLPKKWDSEVDVLVIGSGFAGLAAGIEAAEAGAVTVIIDKMPVPGGNSIINGGLVSAAGSPKQDKEKINDSPDLMYKDMLKAGLGLNHQALARVVTEKSNEAVQWTIKHLGAQYKDRNLHLGGHSVPRSYYTTNSSGSGIVRPQLNKVKDLGIPLKLNCYLEQVYRDEDGRIKGVNVREGYKFLKEGSGQSISIKVRRGVVVAAGGFANDVIYRKIQDPKVDDKVQCTNHQGATAECLKELLRLHANPVQLSWIQLGPWSCPLEKGMGIGYIFAINAAFPYGIMVSPKTGKRFINELADRKIRADAIINTGEWAVGIADQEGVKRTAKIDKMLERGIVKKFDTIEALAKEYKINVAEYKKTIFQYNSFVKSGKDTEWGKPFQSDCKPITTPPFYGMYLWPKAHHTMGGAQINTKAQVIDLNQNVIPGLYAAGEITGGVHGAVRLGSVAITDCLVFGRIAGKQVAGEKPWA